MDPNFKVNTIFVNGFVDGRLHNRDLLGIIRHLSPTYYIGRNTTLNSEIHSVKDLIAEADLVICFINEFVLEDTICSFAMKVADNLKIPIVPVKSARTLKNEGLYSDRVQSLCAESVIFDRTEFAKSMIRLRTRIYTVLSRKNDFSSISSTVSSTYRGVKLPKIPPKQMPRLQKKNQQISLNRLPQRLLTARKRSQSAGSTNPFKRFSLDFQPTRYLIFHKTGVSQRPNLVEFDGSDDMLKGNLVDDSSSLWGSDTSYEEDVERAGWVLGSLRDLRTPPFTPKSQSGSPV